jgi:sodium-dependent dicarboxylate transporter 2/3/5
MSDFLNSKTIGLFLGPLFFVLFILLPFENLSSEACAVLACASWMIVWWITEAVSISVTSLIPLILFPLTGVMSVNDVGANYGSSIVFLFFGGFVWQLDSKK